MATKPPALVIWPLRSGFRRGSLYNPIESKQALLFELMEDALDYLLADTRRALRGEHRSYRFAAVGACGSQGDSEERKKGLSALFSTIYRLRWNL